MATNQDSLALAEKIIKMQEQIKKLEEGSRANRLGNSSIDITTGRGYIPFYENGVEKMRLGRQPDGTVTMTSVNNTDPPPVPQAPSIEPGFSTLTVRCTGLQGEIPRDFSHVRVYVDGTQNGIITKIPGIWVVGPLSATEHIIELTTVNLSGTESERSVPVAETPNLIVGVDLSDGSVTETTIADNAITTPKIRAAAVEADKLAANSVTAGAIEAGAVSADKVEAQFVLADQGFYAGDPNSGSYCALEAAGFTAVSEGDIKFNIDAATGNVTSMGEYFTNVSGERLAMNVANVPSPTMRAYPETGNRYADLRAYTSTVGTTDIANFEFRVPLVRPEIQAGLVDFMVYEEDFTPVDSSRLRYRPFKNASNVVHPGWAADGQDSAVVFFGGRVYITNSANTVRKELVVGLLTSEGNITTPAAVTGRDVYATGGSFHTNFDLNADGFCFLGQGLKVGLAENPVGGRMCARECTLEGNLLVKGTMFNPGAIPQTPSELALKDHISDVTNGLTIVNNLRPSIFTWKDTEHFDDRKHVGIYVDDLAELAPEAIVGPFDPAEIPSDDEELAKSFIANNGRSYEDRALIAYLISAVQELSQKVDELSQTGENL